MGMAGRGSSGRLGRIVAQTFAILGLSLLVTPAQAAAQPDPAEEQYRHRPNAELAAQLGRKALEAGQLARGMNWLERSIRSPGANWQHQSYLGKMQTELKWRLSDAGYGAVQISVHPPKATVQVDGIELPLRGAVHVLWLKEGGHIVDAEAMPDHGPVSQAISARRSERVRVNLTCPLTRAPVLLLHCKQDAEVWLDGAFVGRANKRRFVTTPGTHLVELREPGFNSWVHELSFSIGEEKRFDIDLEREGTDLNKRRQASQVDRPLLPIEVEERGDNRDLGTAPQFDSPLERGKMRPDVDRGNGPPLEEKGRKNFGKLPEAGGREASAGPERSASREPVADAGNVSSGTETSSPSTPWQRTTKGWLFAGTGIAALGSGVALAVLGAQAAEAANQDRSTLGDDDEYLAAFNQGKQQTQIGYAAAGVGAVGLGVGAYYLLGDGGLSRKGKGGLLIGLGAVAEGVAAWLLLDAMSTAKTANRLSLPDVDYPRRYETAEREANVAYGVMAGGAVLAGAGLYLALTGGSSVAALEETTERKWAVVPWLGKGAGGVLSWGW